MPPDAVRNDAILVADDIVVRFQTPEGPITAVDNVSFGVKPGEFLSVIGPSGCGKSTLFNVIGGLLNGYDGIVSVALAPLDNEAELAGQLVLTRRTHRAWTARETRTLREIEMEHILRVLEKHKGSKPAAAAELGISLKTLYNKLNQLEEERRAAG